MNISQVQKLEIEIKINVPLKSDIVHSGIEVPVSKGRGEDKWSRTVLGDYANKKGVYIHRSNRKILYVGKATEGTFGTFGERLRREFQDSSSQSSQLHHLLVSQPEPIFCHFFDLDDIDCMVETSSTRLDKNRKALILEQVLIGIFNPEGNRV